MPGDATFLLQLRLKRVVPIGTNIMMGISKELNNEHCNVFPGCWP